MYSGRFPFGVINSITDIIINTNKMVNQLHTGLTYSWFVLVSISFWIVKSSENEKIFVPHPPHTMFFSAEFVDSLKHISGVLMSPILSFFKGAAPLHFAKKRKHIQLIDYLQTKTLWILSFLKTAFPFYMVRGIKIKIQDTLFSQRVYKYRI